MANSSGKEATKPSAKKSKLWSKLTISNRLSTRCSKLDKELPQKSALSPLTEPLTHHQDGASVSPQESHVDVQAPPSPPITPDVKELREQLVKSRLASVSPSSFKRLKSEFGKFQDDEDTKTSGPVHLCMHGTWELFEFCVLDPLKCLTDSVLSILNYQQPGGKGNKANAKDSSDDLSTSPTISASRSAGTLLIISSKGPGGPPQRT